MDQEKTDTALKYLSLGFSVLPLGSITKDSSGKKVIEFPKEGWKKYQSTLATPIEIQSWNCKNLGIVTGEISNVLVLDVDSYKENFNTDLLKSFNIPITPVQETASGGKQYFFQLPPGISLKNDVCIGSAGSGLDIRANGGMVIVAPSTTSYGAYKWIISPFEEKLAEVPQKLLKLLQNNSSPNSKVRKTLPELVGLKEGEGRNNAIASFVGKLLNTIPEYKWDEEILPMIQVVNETFNPPLSNDELFETYTSITKIETSRKSKSIGKTESSVLTQTISHSELIKKEFSPARYTLEPFFEQGTMNMVSAPPNTWKSWLLFYFAGHIANGTSICGKFSTEKTNVMIVNEEDSARLVQDRLRLLGITEPTLPIFYRIAQGSKLKEEFVDGLIEEAKEKNIGVIMFDSLRSIHEADENDSTSMQGVMDLLKKISRENITTIFTHHHRKKSMFGGKNESAESSRGSSAINAAISGHISLEEVERDEGKFLVIYHLKSKVGEKIQPFELSITTSETGVDFQYLGDHKPKEQALTEAKSRILSELEERNQLLGRKDFVYLKVGGTTTIKQSTANLEKEGKIEFVLRKNIGQSILKPFSNEGKANEKLYSLKKNSADEEFDNFNLTL